MTEETQWVPEGGGEEVTYAALQPGFYNVRVESVDAGYGAKKGTPYITWVLVITDAAFEGSKLFHRTAMSDRAKSFPGDGFYAVLNRFGLSDQLAGKAMDFETMVQLLADVAPGCEAVVAVSIYLYEGQDRNEVDEFFAPGENAPPHQVFAEQSGAETTGEGAEPQGGGSSPPPPTGVTARRPGRRESGGGSQKAPGAEAPY